jgi:hypothetical protein
MNESQIQTLVDNGFDHVAFQREADLRFMLLALRWLREACRRAAAITGDGHLKTALAEFDSSLPAAKDMRDVRELGRTRAEHRRDLEPPETRIHGVQVAPVLGCGDQPKVTTRMPRFGTLIAEAPTLQALTTTVLAAVTLTPPNTTVVGTAVDPVKLNRTTWPT